MKKPYEQLEVRYIDGEAMELLGGNPDEGFVSKAKAQKLATEWKSYPRGGKARVLFVKGRYWVYGT
jgi:hypothetical protein